MTETSTREGTRSCVDRARRAAYAFACMVSLALVCSHDVVIAQPMLDPAAGDGLIGDPETGKEFWERIPTSSCKNCHGIRGQGGFAPPLAGRGLTTRDFIRAVTHPAIMPEFPQYTAQQMANFAAHFARLPTVSTPGAWRFPMPAGAGQGLMIAFAIGCAQCHGPELETPRHSAGAVFADADFEWFKTHVYRHTSVVKDYWALLELPNPPPFVRMGNYSRDRLPESVLAQIWGWMTEEGLLTPVTASLPEPELSAAGAEFRLTLLNQGLPGKGLVAEDVTVRLILPAGAEIVSAEGRGYQGVAADPESGAPAAIWRIATIAPRDTAELVLTLTHPGTEDDGVRGYATWPGEDSKHPERLSLRVGQRPRNMP